MNKQTVTKVINFYLVGILLLCMVVVALKSQQPVQEEMDVPCRTIGLQGMCTDTFRKLINSPDVRWNIGGPSRSPYWYETNCELSAQGEYINCPEGK